MLSERNLMLTFERGRKYSRPDIKELASLGRHAKGGDWDTGIVEHGEGEFLIFANVGTEGRTGHDYGNRWEADCLRWYHKKSSHLPLAERAEATERRKLCPHFLVEHPPRTVRVCG